MKENARHFPLTPKLDEVVLFPRQSITSVLLACCAIRPPFPETVDVADDLTVPRPGLTDEELEAENVSGGAPTLEREREVSVPRKFEVIDA